MGRRAREISETGLYHIVFRGINTSFLKIWNNKVGGVSVGYAGYTSYYNIMGLQDRGKENYVAWNNAVDMLRDKTGFCTSGAVNYPEGYNGARRVVISK